MGRRHHTRRAPAPVSRVVAAGLCVAALAACGPDEASTDPTAAATTAAASIGSPTAPATAPSTLLAVTTSPGASSPPPTRPAGDWPSFASSIEPVTAERLGATWRPGCPVGPQDLALVRVSYATAGGSSATGELVVARSAAADVVAAFAELYAARFPITRMVTIDAYDGDDDRSMAADNTSAFNCRAVTGGDGWSRHAYGLAIDINPLLNPYVSGDVVLPPAGRAYLDRSRVRPGMIVAGDPVVRAFTSRGFEWGGDFTSLKDYQHFAR